MIDNKRLINLHGKLKDIPHLNLTKYLPQIPTKDIIRELLQFSDNDFQSYQNGLIRKELLETMQKNWHGLCLIENCKEGRHHIDYKTTDDHNLTFHDNNEHHPTDIGKLMPRTVKYLYSIAARPERTRLLKLKPNGDASWHSHYVLAKSGFTTIDGENYVNPVIQIPLITNSRVEMLVSKSNPLTDTNAFFYKEKYNVGEVWVFNSYHYHNVYNKGRYDRDHIMMYASLDDEKLFPILETAVAEYNGPYIK